MVPIAILPFEEKTKKKVILGNLIAKLKFNKS